MAKKCGLECLSIATPYSRYYGASAYNSPFVFNRSFFWVSVVSKLIERFVDSDRAYLFRRGVSVRIWKKILVRVEPEAVIGIQPCRFLCIAAKDLGVKVFDYQHGVISKDHLWYGHKLPFEMRGEELPSGILCWDQASADALSSWAQERSVEVVVLGNPWVRRFIVQDEADDLVFGQSVDMYLAQPMKPSILVSLQWGLGEKYYKNSGFNGIMSDSLKGVILKTQEKYNWLIRLHPVQLRGVEEKIVKQKLKNMFEGCNGVEWEAASNAPLPLVLKNCDLHLTDMSTVVKEAAWFGVPSGILNPFLRDGGMLQNLYKEERESGIAKLLENSESDIELWIEKEVGRNPIFKMNIFEGSISLEEFLKRFVG